MFFPFNKLEKFCHRHKEIFLKPEGEYLTHHPMFGVIHPTKTKDILPVVLAKGIFEGKDFFVPKNTHQYLKDYFDSNYMDLPPEEERVSHHKVLEVEIK